MEKKEQKNEEEKWQMIRKTSNHLLLHTYKSDEQYIYTFILYL